MSAKRVSIKEIELKLVLSGVRSPLDIEGLGNQLTSCGSGIMFDNDDDTAIIFADTKEAISVCLNYLEEHSILQNA